MKLLDDAQSTGYQHRWMWDLRSLRVLLEHKGCVTVTKETAFTSCVSRWTSFVLDTSSDGSECKLGSLYCEAMRPL